MNKVRRIALALSGTTLVACAGMQVMLPSVKGRSEDQIRDRQGQLRQLSEAMVAEARARAEQVRAFE